MRGGPWRKHDRLTRKAMARSIEIWSQDYLCVLVQREGVDTSRDGQVEEAREGEREVAREGGIGGT